MATLNLDRLNVSLTKHGSAKLAPLLRTYPAADVLRMLSGKVPGINIDLAQAKKNLSVGSDGRVPAVWEKARTLGHRAIDGLTLIGIIFSHHELMAAMARARKAPFAGRLLEGEILAGKAYTNFAYALEELRFSITHTPEAVVFDLRPLFEIEGVGPLAHDLLGLKLRRAGWNGEGDAVDVMVANGFHDSLAISEVQFRNWLERGSIGAAGMIAKDADFLEGTDEAATATAFAFKCGHKPRKTGKVRVGVPAAERDAELRHNELQTELYKKLVDEYGEESVGTENPTGMGTALDAVVIRGTKYWFYEIKIANTLRACLRQAIPQLLEYAYWRCDDSKIEKLIIVGTFAGDAAAEAYLEFLRTRFQIPIYYEQFSP